VTFLELVVALAKKAAIPSNDITDVTTETNESGRVVDWIKDAWLDIQTLQSIKWKFLHTEYTKNTVASTQDYEFYVADDIQQFDIDSFTYYKTADGANTRQKLTYIDYRIFKQKYRDFTDESEPVRITVTPTNSLRLYPIPDDVYTIEVDAFSKPQELAINADVPSVPTNFHMMIVWKALIDYAGYEEAGAVFSHAAMRFDELYNQLLWQEKYETEQSIVSPGEANH
jgi:hypothetical protein